MASKPNPLSVPEFSEFTVAPRRTVTTDSGHKGPGEKVQLSSDEATRLQALGFILAADGTLDAQSTGPAVNMDNGKQV